MKGKRLWVVFMILLFIVPSFIVSVSIFGKEQKSLLDSLLDWSLYNAGIDPNSDEANQIAENWMDPLSSKEQIDEELKQRRVQQILDNPVLSKEQKRQQLRTIVGDVKWCPQCKQKWPVDYIYCPHHGTVLTWSRNTFTAKDGSEMILIPAGEFRMGSNYYTDNLVAKYISGFSPSKEYWNSEEQIIRFWLEKSVLNQKISDFQIRLTEP